MFVWMGVVLGVLVLSHKEVLRNGGMRTCLGGSAAVRMCVCKYVSMHVRRNANVKDALLF